MNNRASKKHTRDDSGDVAVCSDGDECIAPDVESDEENECVRPAKIAKHDHAHDVVVMPGVRPQSVSKVLDCEDLLRHILKFVDMETLLQEVAIVCKSIQSCVYSASTWRRVSDRGSYLIHPNMLVKIASYASMTESIELASTNVTSAAIDAIANICTSLKKLVLRHVDFSECDVDAITNLVEVNTGLSEVRFCPGELSVPQFDRMTSNHAKLRVLRISPVVDIRFHTPSVLVEMMKRLPNLRDFSLGGLPVDTWLAVLAVLPPQLESVIIQLPVVTELVNTAHGIGNVLELMHRFADLTSLEMLCAPCIKTDSLVNFLVDHPLLQVLRLVEPSGIDDVIAYPMEDDLLEAIGMCCPSLKELSIDIMSEDVCHFTNIGIMLATRCTTLEVLRLKVAQESFSVLTLIDVASSLPALRQLFLSPVDFTPVYNRTRDNALVRSASMPNVTCRMTNRTAPGADVFGSSLMMLVVASQISMEIDTVRTLMLDAPWSYRSALSSADGLFYGEIEVDFEEPLPHSSCVVPDTVFSMM